MIFALLVLQVGDMHGSQHVRFAFKGAIRLPQYARLRRSLAGTKTCAFSQTQQLSSQSDLYWSLTLLSYQLPQIHHGAVSRRFRCSLVVDTENDSCAEKMSVLICIRGIVVIGFIPEAF